MLEIVELARGEEIVRERGTWQRAENLLDGGIKSAQNTTKISKSDLPIPYSKLGTGTNALGERVDEPESSYSIVNCCSVVSSYGRDPPEDWGLKMQKCQECTKLQQLLQESAEEYLAAMNRYNTWLSIPMGNAWAAGALRTAKAENEELQKRFDEHVRAHSVLSGVMAAGA